VTVRSAFDILVRQQLSAVTFVHDYLQLQFNPTPRLNLYTPGTVYGRDAKATQGEPLFAHLVVRQIGHLVQSVWYRESDALELMFPKEYIVSISLNPDAYSGPEAVEMSRDDDCHLRSAAPMLRVRRVSINSSDACFTLKRCP